jgi:hypothetical protein
VSILKSNHRDENNLALGSVGGWNNQIDAIYGERNFENAASQEVIEIK